MIKRFGKDWKEFVKDWESVGGFLKVWKPPGTFLKYPRDV
jgi:hypothetical protein